MSEPEGEQTSTCIPDVSRVDGESWCAEVGLFSYRDVPLAAWLNFKRPAFVYMSLCLDLGMRRLGKVKEEKNEQVNTEG